MRLEHGVPGNGTKEIDGIPHLMRFLLSDGGDDRALLLIDRDGVVTEAHAAAATLLGSSTDELRGITFASLLANTSATRTGRPRLLEQILNGGNVHRRCWCMRRNRSRFWAEIIAAPIYGNSSNVTGAAVAIRDLTELKRAEGEARAMSAKSLTPSDSENTASAILDGISNALLVVDNDWRFVYVNERCAQVLRKPREQLIGVPLWQELPVGDGAAFHRQLMKAASERMPVQFEEFYPLLNAWFEIHVYPYSRGLVVYFWDVSDRKLDHARVQLQSLHDPLTGVANTLLFDDRATTALARARRTETTLAVLAVDVDDFGAVNAMHGHGIGDLLLKGLAGRLSGVVRRSDTIARLSGDRFAVLTSDHREADGPALLAEKLLAAAAQTFELAETSVEITASAGIALFPQDGPDLETLNRAAQIALAAAKADGGNSYRFSSHVQTAEVLRRRALESDLRDALLANQLELWYQPERAVVGGGITAVEALLRWNRANGLRERPGQLLPNIFSTELIVQIDEWVMTQACKQRAAWASSFESQAPVTVNISPATLLFGDLDARVRRALALSGLHSSLLELEFSQPELVRADALVNDTLRNLHEMGVRLSLDDVGANGWATVAVVAQYPFGKIKLDPTLIAVPDDEIHHESAIRAACAFAHSLQRHVVAENVATKEQLALMKLCGCDAAQGDIIGAATRYSDAGNSFLALNA